MLLEFYAIGKGSNLRNLSARGFVSDSELRSLNIGFVIAPDPTPTFSSSRLVLLRAAGPGLRAFGVANVVPAPRIELFSGTTLLAQNTGIGTAPNGAAIADATAVFGAFPFVAGSADSALLLQLPAGEYIMRVSSALGTSGIALAELYTNIGF